MKNQALRIFAVMGLAVLLAAPAAFAQLSEQLVADIPFDFIVAGRVYPAGNYEIRPLPNMPAVTIRSADQGVAIAAMTLAAWSPAGKVQPSLTFNRTENKYFLSKLNGYASGCTLRTSKTERELAAKVAPQPLSIAAFVRSWR
jgi:hypothetical protein